MKELKRQRLEILAKIDDLQEKCDCRSVSDTVNNCSNCKAMKKLGDKLLKNLAQQKKKKGVVQLSIEPRQNKLKYPPGLTVKEYLYLKSLLLTDQQIAKTYEVTFYVINTFKREFKIDAKHPNTRLSTLEAKRIVIRERKRIKQKYKKEVS